MQCCVLICWEMSCCHTSGSIDNCHFFPVNTDGKQVKRAPVGQAKPIKCDSRGRFTKSSNGDIKKSVRNTTFMSTSAAAGTSASQSGEI